MPSILILQSNSYFIVKLLLPLLLWSLVMINKSNLQLLGLIYLLDVQPLHM